MTGEPIQCMNRVEAVVLAYWPPVPGGACHALPATASGVVAAHVFFEVECIDRMYCSVGCFRVSSTPPAWSLTYTGN